MASKNLFFGLEEILLLQVQLLMSTTLERDLQMIFLCRQWGMFQLLVDDHYIILNMMKKINKDPQKNQINYVDWIELIKFKETRNYVQRVLENYNVYRYVLEQKPIPMKNFFKNNPLF